MASVFNRDAYAGFGMIKQLIFKAFTHFKKQNALQYPLISWIEALNASGRSKVNVTLSKQTLQL